MPTLDSYVKHFDRFGGATEVILAAANDGDISDTNYKKLAAKVKTPKKLVDRDNGRKLA